MLMDWGNLPLLPLECVLGYLRNKDVLAASSVCRHWRSALLMFGGRMDILKLRTSDVDRNCFLTSVFREQVKKIYVYIDSSSTDLQQFMALIFTQFYNMKMVKDVTFVGPNYLKQESYTPVFMLKRRTLNSLLFSNLDMLRLMGCSIKLLEAPEEEERTCLQEGCDEVAYSLPNVFRPTKGINLENSAAGFSMLQFITIEYDYLTFEVVTSLSHLKNLKCLNVNITEETNIEREPIEWLGYYNLFPNGLNLCLNMISVPVSKFDSMISHVLMVDLPLNSLKVMFCKTLHLPMIKRMAELYKHSLRELVWVDSPFDPVLDKDLLKFEEKMDSFTMFNMNPLVMLCWQCNHLERLVVHGYWIWHYDLVGCVRLRSLGKLEVSAVEVRETHYLRLRGGAAGHVLTTDSHNKLDRDILHHINKYMNMKWKPRSWRKLHPAVRGPASPQHRVDYVLYETKQTYNIM